MALDHATLDSPTPRTRDGRRYPEHLRRYEVHDKAFLQRFQQMGEEVTAKALALTVAPPRLRSLASRWLASAEWRGLVERRDDRRTRRRTYAMTDRGRRRLQSLKSL